MVGINAFISTNTINAPVIQSTDIVAVSVLEAAAHCKKNKKQKKEVLLPPPEEEPPDPLDGFKYRKKGSKQEA